MPAAIWLRSPSTSSPSSLPPARNKAPKITGEVVVVCIIVGVIQTAGIRVYLEAIILGKPVVITRGASTEDILHKDLAVTLPPGALYALRDAPCRMRGNGALGQCLSEGARKYALSFDDHERLFADLRSVIHTRPPTCPAMPQPRQLQCAAVFVATRNGIWLL